MQRRTWTVTNAGRSVSFETSRSLRAEIRRVFSGRFHEHRWEGWVPLVEPGISDVKDGEFARVAVVCARCEEKRRVWRGVLSSSTGMSWGCPGFGGSRGRKGRAANIASYNKRNGSGTGTLTMLDHEDEGESW